ncbi:DUF177 domain-containing protein [Patescibacteria group bacterium]|nr:DUF177 domain-containing protein [Patescibacteria group bacterium]
MNLDVKNLAFGAVGETDDFDIDSGKYQITEDFFVTSLKGKIKLTRLEDSILAKFLGEFNSKLCCDRCLEDYKYSQRFEFSREYFLGGFREDEEDLLVSKNFEVDITEPIREEILLSLPFKKICEETCKGLCVHCGKNLNTGKCKCGKV